jgi:hypothetical protein
VRARGRPGAAQAQAQRLPAGREDSSSHGERTAPHAAARSRRHAARGHGVAPRRRHPSIPSSSLCSRRSHAHGACFHHSCCASSTLQLAGISMCCRCGSGCCQRPATQRRCRWRLGLRERGACPVRRHGGDARRGGAPCGHCASLVSALQEETATSSARPASRCSSGAEPRRACDGLAWMMAQAAAHSQRTPAPRRRRGSALWSCS